CIQYPHYNPHYDGGDCTRRFVVRYWIGCREPRRGRCRFWTRHSRMARQSRWNLLGTLYRLTENVDAECFCYTENIAADYLSRCFFGSFVSFMQNTGDINECRIWFQRTYRSSQLS